LSPFETHFEHIQAGRRFTPLIYTVSEGLILQYADAVDESNFFHRGPVKASSGPFGGMIAPPTLASLFVLKAYRTDWSPPPRRGSKGPEVQFFRPDPPWRYPHRSGRGYAKGKKRRKLVPDLCQP